MYNRLSLEKAMDYEHLKVALLERYDFTKRGYREKFREARPEGHESPSKFICRLKHYFTKWIELAKVEQTFMGVVDLIVREQFTSSIHTPNKGLFTLRLRSMPNGNQPL